MDAKIKETLIAWAQEYNDPKYFQEDPIAFPTRFARSHEAGQAQLADVEISALLSAHLAWGRRAMIVRDCERMFEEMSWRPYDYVMNGEYRDENASLHRTIKWSELRRPDSRGTLKPVAANVDLIVIVFAPLPEPHANLIDRYIIAAEHAGIKPLLLLNKSDLLDPSGESRVHSLLNTYHTLGYPLLEVSAYSGDGLAKLQEQLNDQVSVFVGQSGVGKSSLVNRLLPNTDTRVGALSELTGKGTHTTTTARLFHFPAGGQLIDSPGIREFGLGHVSVADVEAGFIEFQEHLGHCRFRNCSHEHEPGCALLAAVEEGKIHPQRLASFKHIISGIKQDQH